MVCPAVPDAIELAAAGGADPIQPLTGRALRQHRAHDAWLDGQESWYLDGLNDTYAASATGRVSEGKLYRFVTNDDPTASTLIRVPVVLAANSQKVSLYREQHVRIPAGAQVFVPAGEAVPPGLPTSATPANVDPNIPAATAALFRLRVASDPGCFSTAASFPTGCKWLDSAAAIEALPSGTIVVTEMLVGGPTLLVGDNEL